MVILHIIRYGPVQGASVLWMGVRNGDTISRLHWRCELLVTKTHRTELVHW